MNNRKAAKNAFQLENAQPFLFFSRSLGMRPAAASRETEVDWPPEELLADMPALY